MTNSQILDHGIHVDLEDSGGERVTFGPDGDGLGLAELALFNAEGTPVFDFRMSLQDARRLFEGGLQLLGGQSLLQVLQRVEERLGDVTREEVDVLGSELKLPPGTPFRQIVARVVQRREEREQFVKDVRAALGTPEGSHPVDHARDLRHECAELERWRAAVLERVRGDWTGGDPTKVAESLSQQLRSLASERDEWRAALLGLAKLEPTDVAGKRPVDVADLAWARVSRPLREQVEVLERERGEARGEFSQKLQARLGMPSTEPPNAIAKLAVELLDARVMKLVAVASALWPDKSIYVDSVPAEEFYDAIRHLQGVEVIERERDEALAKAKTLEGEVALLRDDVARLRRTEIELAAAEGERNAWRAERVQPHGRLIRGLPAALRCVREAAATAEAETRDAFIDAACKLAAMDERSLVRERIVAVVGIVDNLEASYQQALHEIHDATAVLSDAGMQGGEGESTLIRLARGAVTDRGAALERERWTLDEIRRTCGERDAAVAERDQLRAELAQARDEGEAREDAAMLAAFEGPDDRTGTVLERLAKLGFKRGTLAERVERMIDSTARVVFAKNEELERYTTRASRYAMLTARLAEAFGVERPNLDDPEGHVRLVESIRDALGTPTDKDPVTHTQAVVAERVDHLTHLRAYRRWIAGLVGWKYLDGDMSTPHARGIAAEGDEQARLRLDDELKRLAGLVQGAEGAYKFASRVIDDATALLTGAGVQPLESDPPPVGAEAPLVDLARGAVAQIKAAGVDAAGDVLGADVPGAWADNVDPDDRNHRTWTALGALVDAAAPAAAQTERAALLAMSTGQLVEEVESRAKVIADQQQTICELVDRLNDLVELEARVGNGSADLGSVRQTLNALKRLRDDLGRIPARSGAQVINHAREELKNAREQLAQVRRTAEQYALASDLDSAARIDQAEILQADAARMTIEREQMLRDFGVLFDMFRESNPNLVVASVQRLHRELTAAYHAAQHGIVWRAPRRGVDSEETVPMGDPPGKLMHSYRANADVGDATWDSLLTWRRQGYETRRWPEDKPMRIEREELGDTIVELRRNDAGVLTVYVRPDPHPSAGRHTADEMLTQVRRELHVDEEDGFWQLASRASAVYEIAEGVREAVGHSDLDFGVLEAAVSVIGGMETLVKEYREVARELGLGESPAHETLINKLRVAVEEARERGQLHRVLGPIPLPDEQVFDSEGAPEPMLVTRAGIAMEHRARWLALRADLGVPAWLQDAEARTWIVEQFVAIGSALQLNDVADLRDIRNFAIDRFSKLEREMVASATIRGRVEQLQGALERSEQRLDAALRLNVLVGGKGETK